MKNKKLYIVLLIIAVCAIALIVSCVLITKNNKKKLNAQYVDMQNGVINDVELYNKIKLSKGAVTKVGDKYQITMRATNNTKNTIDMSVYRISFRDVTNNEIEWFMGDVIGQIKPQESVNFTIESFNDLATLDKIVYELFVLE